MMQQPVYHQEQHGTSHHTHPKAPPAATKHTNSTHTHHQNNLDDRFAPKPKHHQEDMLHDKIAMPNETIVEIVVVVMCAACVHCCWWRRLGLRVVACPACIRSQEQVGQQMVLCPVRVVYETQMLVQPGEQIHPNQTILINPQNPPPWIQNRQVQNQVIYVQHVPTNYVPPPQQHIDQNQVYIQNYSYQNIPQIQNVPQMYVQNPQEHIRPLQVVPNMIQNMPTNINTIQNPRMVSHVAPMPQSVNIVNAPQNQINTVNRMVAPSQVNPNELINRSQETVTQNSYRHQIPQVIHDQRFQAQPTITMVPHSLPNIQRVPQAFESNINQIRPSQHVTANIQQTYANTIFHSDENKKITLPGNKGNNMNIVNPVSTVRNLPQTYRPIQPRTSQNRSNAPTLMPVQSSSNQMQHLVPNITTINNAPRKILPNNSVTVINNVNTTLSNIKVEGNNLLFNRKRKSESPDEIHKKVSVSNQTDNPIIIKHVTNASYPNCADVGVNTSPLHRRSGKIAINNLQITPIPPATTTPSATAIPSASTTSSKLTTELGKPIRSNTTTTEAEKLVTKNITQPPETSAVDTLPTDKDKLIRNTVYVQARGRILTDKDNVPEMPKIETIATDPEVNISLPSIQEQQEIKKETSIPEIETKNVLNPITCKPGENDSTNNNKKESTDGIAIKVDKIKVEGLAKVATDDMKSSKIDVKLKKESTADIKKDGSNEEVKLKEESTSNVTLKAESMTENKSKEERGFILTHVLGGFVIQESNIAFPIRKPLKEKILYSNTDEIKKENKERQHEGLIMKDNSKILDISHLNINECENMEAEAVESKNDDEKENPFTLLKPSEVKSWSAEQLATHLAKYDWTDTVSVLQEHELDGESLLLVSKAQLVTIGVKEEHAEIISDFVKS